MSIPATWLESTLPCRNCLGGCCRSYVVPVTGHDIHRLRQTTGLPLWDLICRWVDAEKTIPEDFAPRFRFRDRPESGFVLALSQHSSQWFPHTDCCRFLVEQELAADQLPVLRDGAPDRIAYCSVHEARPGVCRLFPLEWREDGLRQHRVIPEYGREPHHPAYRLCGRNWTDAEIQEHYPSDLLTRLKDELDVWREVADLWNQTGHGPDELPEFLEAIYSRL